MSTTFGTVVFWVVFEGSIPHFFFIPHLRGREVDHLPPQFPNVLNIAVLLWILVCMFPATLPLNFFVGFWKIGIEKEFVIYEKSEKTNVWNLD